MRRINSNIGEEQYTYLKKRAFDFNMSFSAVLRECIEYFMHLPEESPENKKIYEEVVNLAEGKKHIKGTK